MAIFKPGGNWKKIIKSYVGHRTVGQCTPDKNVTYVSDVMLRQWTSILTIQWRISPKLRIPCLWLSHLLLSIADTRFVIISSLVIYCGYPVCDYLISCYILRIPCLWLSHLLLYIADTLFVIISSLVIYCGYPVCHYLISWGLLF